MCIKMAIRYWTMLVLLHGVACSPPQMGTTVVNLPLTQKHLADAPAELAGDLSHVTAGIWRAPDGAFAVRAVPFLEGPTEFVDTYGKGGVTNHFFMLDRKESVVAIVRTKIRPDLQQADVLQRVEPDLRRNISEIPGGELRWIDQAGRRQIETVNPSVNYKGREGLIWLVLGEGSTYGVTGTCRVDRRFVEGGYYFQIIAVSHRTEPTSIACDTAREMAAWTASEIRLN